MVASSVIDIGTRVRMRLAARSARVKSQPEWASTRRGFRIELPPEGHQSPTGVYATGAREYSTQIATSPATFRSLYHPKDRPTVAIRRNWAQFGLSLRERQLRIMPAAPDVHPDAGADEAPRIPFVRDPTFWQAGCAAAAGRCAG